MKKKTLTMGQISVLEIMDIPGDLRVRGWEHNEVQAKTSGDILELIAKDEKISLKCDDDLILSLPKNAKLKIANIADDASFRNVGQVEIDNIGGDLSLRYATSLTLKSVGDDASIRNVAGAVSIDQIGDDLYLRDVEGNINASVGDDAILYISPQKDTQHKITAGDDILLRLPDNADVRLDLNAGDELNIDCPNTEKSDGKQRRKLDLGLATAKITLSAGGDLRVTSASEPWADAASFDIPLPFLDADFPKLADDFAEKISRKMDTFPDEIFDEISTHLDDFPDRFAERISRKLDSKYREADKKMRKAEKKAQEAEKKMRQAEQKQKRENFAPENWGKKGKSTPVSNDERLLILKMLEEKKISAEDASKLLAALEA